MPSSASQPHPDSDGQPRSPGRPLRLTDEVQEKIVALVRAGAFQGAAAEAAGVPERTFYEWRARGRGEHRTRRATPRLRAFAQAVDQAAAEARMGAEIRVYREQPKFWLTHAARSKLESEGWTEPKDQSGGGGGIEELIRELDAQGIHPPN